MQVQLFLKHKAISLFMVVMLIVSACGGPAPTEAPAVAPTDAQQAAPTTAPEAPAPTEAAPQAVPEPVFSLIGGQVNRDVTQAGQNPSLAFGRTDANTSPTLWVTWAENSPGNTRQIFASELLNGAFNGRGTTLNIHTNVAADAPSITFAGEGALAPWVAWVEPSPGFGNVPQIFASRFNAATGLWQMAGLDRGGGEATINLNTDRPASRPFAFSGSGDPAAPPVPWIVWEEESASSNFVQLFVAKGVRDDAGIGGFRWDVVGELQDNDEPTLNVDIRRDAQRPTAVFAESGNAVPWVTWHEISLDRPSRVFSARGVADANAPGGFRWTYVPACARDETACSLNVNPLKDAKDAWTAAGSLTPGEATVPWIAWAELGPTNKWQIFVSRLDPSTRNSFVNVGGSLNVDQNHDARTPFISFVGNVPYVSWLEDDGAGKFVTQIRHLASDPQTGTWVLDTPPGGVNANKQVGDFGLYTVASSDALFLSWTEGDPAGSASQIVAARLLGGTAQTVQAPAAALQPAVITGAGAEVAAKVDEYRAALGGVDNGGEPGSKGSGFRQINWDGVTDEESAPNFYPSALFNAPTAPRARGAVLTTPGEGLQVSADSDNPTGTPPRFGHLNANYANIFKAFSEERLFSPVGSNIADLTFFVPGSDQPAVVSGFGAIYTDVDTEHTAFEYFDINGNSLGSFATPLADNDLSFLGVVFPTPIVHRVRITYGTSALGPDDGSSVDVAVMDDFIYGEPVPAQ
jgi:hypothetical protein